MPERRAYRCLYDRVLSRFYDLYMSWYMLPYGGHGAFRRRMLEGLEFMPVERVIDCTCGTGGCTTALRDRLGPEAVLVGSDLSMGQLRMARAKRALLGVPLLEADASRLPFAAAAFDSVFVPHAIHEMPRALRLAVLGEARRVCGAGRVVVLELDRPQRRWLRWLMGLWFFYWVPPPINFETRTRRDMERHGVAAEVAEAGFSRVSRLSKFGGTMQVVEGRP